MQQQLLETRIAELVDEPFSVSVRSRITNNLIDNFQTPQDDLEETYVVNQGKETFSETIAFILNIRLTTSGWRVIIRMSHIAHENV